MLACLLILSFFPILLFFRFQSAPATAERPKRPQRHCTIKATLKDAEKVLAPKRGKKPTRGTTMKATAKEGAEFLKRGEKKEEEEPEMEVSI